MDPLEMKKMYFKVPIDSLETYSNDSILIKGVVYSGEVTAKNSRIASSVIDTAMLRYMTVGNVYKQHESWDAPVGNAKAYDIVDHSLTSIINRNIPMSNGSMLFDEIRENNMRGYSIGFYILPGGTEMKMVDIQGIPTEVKEYTKIDIFDVSVVYSPADPLAVFTIVDAISYSENNPEKAKELESIEYTGESETSTTGDTPPAVDAEDTTIANQIAKEVAEGNTSATAGSAAPIVGDTGDTPPAVETGEIPALQKDIEALGVTISEKDSEIATLNEALSKSIDSLESVGKQISELSQKNIEYQKEIARLNTPTQTYSRYHPADTSFRDTVLAGGDFSISLI